MSFGWARASCKTFKYKLPVYSDKCGQGFGLRFRVRVEGVLGGSWAVTGGGIRPLILFLSIATLLITRPITILKPTPYRTLKGTLNLHSPTSNTTHEPPSRLREKVSQAKHVTASDLSSTAHQVLGFQGTFVHIYNIYIHMYIYIYVYSTYMHMYIYIYKPVHAHIYIYMYVCMYVCEDIFQYVYTQICTDICVCIYI